MCSTDADFAIANVQCQYDASDEEEGLTSPKDPVGVAVAGPRVHDHTYDTRDEPPAYVIQQVSGDVSGSHVQITEACGRSDAAKIMTLGPGAAGLNVIHVGDRPQYPPASECSINKRIRRSEAVLHQAADCVRRGSTFQTVSDHFRIPISTIRFFMARKGILPRRRRGRTTQLNNQAIQSCTSPEPPFHMQHYKLPDMVALRGDDEPRVDLTH